jgi:hypothetical protein
VRLAGRPHPSVRVVAGPVPGTQRSLKSSPRRAVQIGDPAGRGPRAGESGIPDGESGAADDGLAHGGLSRTRSGDRSPSDKGPLSSAPLEEAAPSADLHPIVMALWLGPWRAEGPGPQIKLGFGNVRKRMGNSRMNFGLFSLKPLYFVDHQSIVQLKQWR